MDLTNHSPVKRGNLSGAIVDNVVVVNWGSVKGYPDGDSVLWKLHASEINDMIAILSALKQTRGMK